MRYLMQFNKTGAAAYISHLDLQRAMQRAMRRSGLPLRYSLGFNPHPVVSFAMAAPVGMTSYAEYVDATVEDYCELDKATLSLIKALPKELAPSRARLVEDDYPKLTSRVASAEYVITFDEPFGLAAKWAEYISKDTIEIMKRGKGGVKPLDAKPLILESDIEGAELRLRLSAGSASNLNPLLLAKDMCEKTGLGSGFVCVQRTLLAGSGTEPSDLFSLDEGVTI